MPTRKRQGNNPHNNRHENGVVAPGKRITRQKSNGQINGNVVASLPVNGVASPYPSINRTTPLVPEQRIKRHPHNANDDQNTVTEQDDEPTATAVESSEASLVNAEHTNGHPTGSKTGMSVSKSLGVPKSNGFNLALTILRSCPLGDTLTILIILLSIPSTVLTLINALFAMLTFMPPAGSFFSLPNTFNDIFQGSGGTPSLATIIITDILGLMIWLVAWTPFQALAIEYTQAVVAATLGGGNTNKRSGYDSTMLCMAIVTFRHVSCRGWVPARILGLDWPAILSKIPYVNQRAISFIPIPSDDFLTIDPRGGWGWFRILIALHILIQGLVHVARRWYQKREYFQSPPIGKKVDPEAGTASPLRHNSSTVGDNSTLSTHAQAPNTSTKLPLAVVKDARDKISSGKKKRKQATLVRSQQPLWAAFAATKVTIMREYEQTHSMADVNVSSARDAGDLGSAAFEDSDDRVWISKIYSDSFIFHTTCLTPPDHAYDRSKAEAGTRPFYVRINDTDWTSTTISRNSEENRADGHWSGIVSGLTPSSSYRCRILHSEDDEVMFSGTVTTSPSLIEEAEPQITSSEGSFRNNIPYTPTSPTTTLKKSISALESSLTESNARQKRTKRDCKATSAAIKKDIDVFHGKIARLANEDRSHTNRHLQWNQNMKQADEAVLALSNEIGSLARIPEDELKLSEERKVEWEEAKQHQSATRESLGRCRDSLQREKSALQNEASSAQQKKERLFARKSKLNDQYERMESATAEGFHEKERKNSAQEAKDLQRHQIEQELQERMANMNEAWHQSRYTISQVVSQAQLLDNAFHESQLVSSARLQPPERPLTPEGDLPGENPHSVAAPYRFPAFGTPESSGGLRSHSDSVRQVEARPRSTSLLSGNSSYADFDDVDPAPPMPSRAVKVIRGRSREGSGGSGGGSSGSNSQRDPASPVVGNHLQDSPFGKMSPVWNH